MHPHHQSMIDRLVERYRDDENVLALVLVGSVARGDARPDSDVDCMMIVTDDEYQWCENAYRMSFSADDLCDYPDGHAGGGIHPLHHLHRIADRGPEPVRFMTSGARPILSRVRGLEELLARCSIYPERERTQKMMSFVSQLPVHLSYLELGEYSRNRYLLAETAVKLVLFGGRLILAHNRMLYPGRKWFMRELGRAPEKPDGIVDSALTLTASPSIAKAREFVETVMTFRDWPKPPEGYWDRYRRDSEATWITGRGPLEDC
ncbi:MAG: nucleotidyltransferase domain-containing protein [Bacillota bacterium]